MVPVNLTVAEWRFNLEESGAQYRTGAGTYLMVMWCVGDLDMSRPCECTHIQGERKRFWAGMNI